MGNPWLSLKVNIKFWKKSDYFIYILICVCKDFETKQKLYLYLSNNTTQKIKLVNSTVSFWYFSEFSFPEVQEILQNLNNFSCLQLYWCFSSYWAVLALLLMKSICDLKLELTDRFWNMLHNIELEIFCLTLNSSIASDWVW